MSYFESIDGSETEIIERIQHASELAIRLEKIALGMRHIPHIGLR
jgi:hypothetical protein